MTDIVHVGVPISTEQAVTAILRMLNTPVIGDITKDSGPGHTLRRLSQDGTLYELLSGGERKLVDIAESIWRGPVPAGAHINALGGLDRTTRRKVLLVLVYFYLGRDAWPEIDGDEFAALFVADEATK